ncbi:hypothetical protein GW17_00035757 [Ensete ventricosum]|nr:hypothetical protein GW17_00035757 [Ensete ventricosum]
MRRRLSVEPAQIRCSITAQINLTFPSSHAAQVFVKRYCFLPRCTRHIIVALFNVQNSARTCIYMDMQLYFANFVYIKSVTVFTYLSLQILAIYKFNCSICEAPNSKMTYNNFHWCSLRKLTLKSIVSIKKCSVYRYIYIYIC